MADFEGGDISSNGGVALLGLAERRLGLLKSVAGRLTDSRQPGKVVHTLERLLRQRVFAVALNYEDVNDHDGLRDDVALQTACGSDARLASSSTVGRLERRAVPEWAWAIHKVLMDVFAASFRKPPEVLVLDFDATDDRVHGNQEGGHYHGYYDGYCFLPLYVFCGDQLLAAYLRPGNCDPALHAAAVLKLLVRQLREKWPGVRIVLRGDSGFCRPRILAWCERNGVDYILGLARNRRLEELAKPKMEETREAFRRVGEKQRRFTEFAYATLKTWHRERRVIARLEYGPQGPNPRFVVTSLDDPDIRGLYEELYCARGEMENRIKEQQLHLFADRTSCHRWWPNQFRLLISAMAYVLIEEIRRRALHGTRLARAQVHTFRQRLLKIGAVLVRNTRRVRIHLSGACPPGDRSLFHLAVARLKPG